MGKELILNTKVERGLLSPAPHLLVGYPLVLGQDLLGKGQVEGALHPEVAVVQDRLRDPPECLLHVRRLVEAVVVVQT